MKYLYWTFRQQLVHHSVNGCNFNSGDFCASGTISGESKDSFGSLMELTWNGRDVIKLEDGGELKFFEDGDVVTFKSFNGDGNGLLQMGEVTGQVIPSLDLAKI